jgi:hypothetical protein
MKTKLLVTLSALVLVLSSYLLYNSLNNEMSEAEIETQFIDLKSDYEFIQKDLEIAVKDVNFDNKEILAQKNRIESLMKKNKLSQEELTEAKEIMRTISKNFLKNYKQRVVVLEGEKLKLLDEKDKIVIEVSKLKDKIDELDKTVIKEKIVSQKKDQLINYASKLTLSNFLLKSFKVRNSGKEIETDRASRIDRIKVSFDINENILAESGEKQIYMVIKKPTGETVTFSNKPSGVFNYRKKKILYSDKIVFNYTKGQEQSLEFVWDNEEFKRGDYVMEVYEQTKQGVMPIGKVTKTLD